jgi:hypothetical protein
MRAAAITIFGTQSRAITVASAHWRGPDGTSLSAALNYAAHNDCAVEHVRGRTARHQEPLRHSALTSSSKLEMPCGSKVE